MLTTRKLDEITKSLSKSAVDIEDVVRIRELYYSYFTELVDKTAKELCVPSQLVYRFIEVLGGTFAMGYHAAQREIDYDITKKMEEVDNGR